MLKHRGLHTTLWFKTLKNVHVWLQCAHTCVFKVWRANICVYDNYYKKETSHIVRFYVIDIFTFLEIFFSNILQHISSSYLCSVHIVMSYM
jgi:hypothetical protein